MPGRSERGLTIPKRSKPAYDDFASSGARCWKAISWQPRSRPLRVSCHTIASPERASPAARRRNLLSRKAFRFFYRRMQMPRNNSKIWTEEQDRRLLELRAAGRSSVSIGAALHRTAKAINGRLVLLRAWQRLEHGQATDMKPEPPDSTRSA